MELGVDAVRLDRQGVEALIWQEFDASRRDHEAVEAVTGASLTPSGGSPGGGSRDREEFDASRLEHQARKL